jgi:hypothetical protein
MLKVRQQQITSTRDLLRQIEGVDGRVTKGVRVRLLGRAGTALSTAALAYVSKQGWSWWLVAPIAGVTLSSAAWTQGRHWIREARRPFRYTYSIDPFEPISAPQDRRLNWALDWIKADLTLMLSDRIGRLSMLPQDQVSGDTPEEPASHIHISGSYGSRYKESGEVTIELMPRVRIGSERCSSKVALAVRFDAAELPDLKRSRRTYDQILERVYFSVATQIYRQIRRDVDRKITRLPTSYLRATAYFHEAEDYARSNTLDAFNDAGDLYTKALDLYDRTRLGLPKHAFLQRPRRWARRELIPVWRWIARNLAFFWPQLGRRDVQIARAKTGYAKALLFRNILANLSGREQKRVFDARRYARNAVETLQRVRDGVEGRREACFEAHVVAALAEHWSGDLEAAKTALKNARDIQPPDANGNALLPFVEGAVEPRLQRKIRLLRRAVELHPRFEIAQFELAFNHEQLWRSSDELEKTGAKLVERMYRSVVTLSPANLTAWANLGYVCWLLWDAKTQDPKHVTSPFEAGRRFKEIREEAFVAELDYGLARVAAESGQIEEAYEHYLAASGAAMAQDATRGYVDYSFDRANESVVQRYERYLATVRRNLAREAKKGTLPKRLLDAVEAFALTDWGNACAAYYRRSREEAYRKKAFAAFESALECNPRYVLALRSRAALNLWINEEDEGVDGDLTLAEKDIKDALEHEPRWVPGLLDHFKTWLALTEHAEGDKEKHIERAEAAFTILVQTLSTPMPNDVLNSSWLTKIERNRRRNEEFLNLVTGPAAAALALYVRLRALAHATGDGYAELCRYLQRNLLPAELNLLSRLHAAADEAAEHLLRTIIEMKVENDPANRYWLEKLADPNAPIEADTRRELLRAAARWPGTSCQTLDWLADELKKVGESGASVEASERAEKKRNVLERRAQSFVDDLIEEHLEDGEFEDEELAQRAETRVADFLDDPLGRKADLLRDIRGSALPTAYVLAQDPERDTAAEILYAIAEEGDDPARAVVAVQALVHLGLDAKELKESLPKVVKKHPSITKTLADWFGDQDRPDLVEALMGLVRTAAGSKTGATASV